MKLSEKIYHCRKKTGKSQEALAEQLGVSRQAVSKWETGESVPEISKLKSLAEAFGVTVDWLLSEEETVNEPEPTAQTNTNWVDAVPGVIGKLLRRYGWLFGIYTALVGVGFTLLGALTHILTRNMLSSFHRASNEMLDSLGSEMSNTVFDFAANNPVFIMGTVLIVIGVVLIVAGGLLAIVLWKKREK